LKLLASRKKIAKNAPIPCNVREDGIDKELSLAENVSREQLHPADEFEAFSGLAEEQGSRCGQHCSPLRYNAASCEGTAQAWSREPGSDPAIIAKAA
jgi:hypothetical protein